MGRKGSGISGASAACLSGSDVSLEILYPVCYERSSWAPPSIPTSAALPTAGLPGAYGRYAWQRGYNQGWGCLLRAAALFRMQLARAPPAACCQGRTAPRCKVIRQAPVQSCGASSFVQPGSATAVRAGTYALKGTTSREWARARQVWACQADCPHGMPAVNNQRCRCCYMPPLVCSMHGV